MEVSIPQKLADVTARGLVFGLVSESIKKTAPARLGEERNGRACSE